MRIKEIQTANPITLKTINNLIGDIKSCDSPLLLINVGEHNFTSIKVMKEFKHRLTTEINSQSHIRKIAFIIPPGIINISEDKNVHQYFNNRVEAVNWLRSFN